MIGFLVFPFMNVIKDPTCLAEAKKQLFSKLEDETPQLWFFSLEPLWVFLFSFFFFIKLWVCQLVLNWNGLEKQRPVNADDNELIFGSGQYYDYFTYHRFKMII